MQGEFTLDSGDSGITIFFRGYLSDFSHDSNKTHDKRNLRKKELILVQSIRRNVGLLVS